MRHEVFPDKEVRERIRDAIVVPEEAQSLLLKEAESEEEEVLRQIRESDITGNFRKLAKILKEVGYPPPTPRHILLARMLKDIGDSLAHAAKEYYDPNDPSHFVIYNDLSDGVFFIMLAITSADIAKRNPKKEFDAERQKLIDDPTGFKLIDYSLDLFKSIMTEPQNTLCVKGAELACKAYKEFYPLTAVN